MSLKFISLQNFFFQNKGLHFDYCNYCSGCLNGMTEEIIQAHLNDCSQHLSKFICLQCGMVSEIFLWHMHFFYFQFKTYFIYSSQNFKKLFRLFLQIHETPYQSFLSLSSKRDHEEMEQGDDEVMEGTDKKIKT